MARHIGACNKNCLSWIWIQHYQLKKLTENKINGRIFLKTYQIHSMEWIKFIHHLNAQWTRICEDAYRFACSRSFEGSLVRTKEITFHSRLKIFWEARIDEKNVFNLQLLHRLLTRIKNGMEQFFLCLHTLTKKFHALTKLYRICYLEDRNRRFFQQMALSII